MENVAAAGRQATRGVVAQGAGDERERHVGRLITAYRSRGHLGANLDPLAMQDKPEAPDLGLAFHRLSENDLSSEFSTGGVGGNPRMKLGDLLARRKATYTGPIGAEFMHSTDSEQRRWLYEPMEAAGGEFWQTGAQTRRVPERLTPGKGLEST